MIYIAGLDIGSRNTKLVIWSPEKQKIVSSRYLPTGIDPLDTVNTLLSLLSHQENINSSDIGSLYVTGYGRQLCINADKSVTEISAHAHGVRYYHPDCRTIIDIGGQDAKIIELDQFGRITDFVMNDKCAAGTGRFLEMTAIRLNCSCDALSGLAASKDVDLSLSSTCVVFAESEIISLIAAGEKATNIAHAVHSSIARRITAQMAAVDVTAPIIFTGGVARNTDLALCLAHELHTTVIRPPDPEMTGALGAALMAAYEQN